MNDYALFTILQCAEKTDGLVGRGDMAKLLLGQDSKKLSKHKFDHLPEYGSLSAMDKKSVLEHIDHLIERGCLSVSSMFFPMITITEAGQNRLPRMIPSIQQVQKIPVKMERLDLGTIHVCDEREFWELFPIDLEMVRHRLIIFSPFVSERRVGTLLHDFEKLVNRNIKITVYTRPINDYESREQKTIELLEQMGVQVIMRKRIHYKVAVIDDNIAWEGSLNILQHWESGEQMTRHDDLEYVRKLLKILKI